MPLVDSLDRADRREERTQITCAQFFMPSGKAVHKTGIAPDIVVEMPQELIGMVFDPGDMEDPQMKRAYEEAAAMAGPAEADTLEPAA